MSFAKRQTPFSMVAEFNDDRAKNGRNVTKHYCFLFVAALTDSCGVLSMTFEQVKAIAEKQVSKWFDDFNFAGVEVIFYAVSGDNKIEIASEFFARRNGRNTMEQRVMSECIDPDRFTVVPLYSK